MTSKSSQNFVNESSHLKYAESQHTHQSYDQQHQKVSNFRATLINLNSDSPAISNLSASSECPDTVFKE
jgi:hypothetical protein